MLTVNKTEYIFIEKYRPKTIDDIIVPQKLKDQMREWVEDGEMPNLLLSSRTPGCLLPGMEIVVDSPINKISANDIISKYNLNQREFKWLQTRIKNQSEYDDNLITEALIKVAKGSLSSKKVYNNDKKYNHRFLKLDYWLYKKNTQEAVQKTKQLRRYKRFFEDTPKGYTKEAALKIMHDLIYSPESYTLKDISTRNNHV